MATRKQTENRTVSTGSRTGKTEARDFRLDLTNNIVGLIEQGVAPWQKPWNPGNTAWALPFNATTQRGYRGGNALHLLARQHQLGSDDPRWCTYKQAEAAGWQIRKGEKATTVEYWQFDREEEQKRDDGSIEKVRVKLKQPRVFYAKVFNAKQIDGIPLYQAPEPKKQWEVSEAAEKVLANCGVPIHHDQLDSAFYRPATDSIHLPTRQSFPEPGDYYEVALHEVAHSSGHASRLNRDLSGRFGSPEYAREELRAQMCSLFLSAELGVPFNPERHAAYQASWIKALQQDKNEIFRAARDAELMADYVIGLSREHTLTHEKEVVEMTETINPHPGAASDVAPKSPQVPFETHDAATNDVAAYMNTAPDDKAARAALAKEMHGKAKADPGYRAALERITPDLSALANARTTVKQREELYTEARAVRERDLHDNPEVRDERERIDAAQARDQAVAALEQRMKSFDWGYVNADDSRSWADGKKGFDAISGELEALAKNDPNKAAALWDSYANHHARPRFLPPAQDKSRDSDVAKANQIRQESDPRGAKEKDIQSGMQNAANAHVNGQAKLYLPREYGKYTGQIVEINERYALQQLRTSNSFVAHPIDALNGQRIKAGERYLMEYNKGVLSVRAPEQTQEKAQERSAPEKGGVGETSQSSRMVGINKELLQLKDQHAGKDAKLVMAKVDDGKAYTGTIIAETGNKVLQRVSGKYVVVHDKSALARDVEVGSQKTLAYEKGRISVLEPSQNRDRSREQEARRAGERSPGMQATEQERRESFFQARNIVVSQFGADAKIRDAKPDVNGSYRGAIIAITKSHVAQQLGANSFVMHEKERLTGSFQKGTHVNIKYQDGKAISALTQQREQQTQNRGMQR